MRSSLPSPAAGQACTAAIFDFEGTLANFQWQLEPAEAELRQVVTRDEVTCMKPRSEGILRMLSDWHVAPGDVLFVGGSRADVFSARAAGMPVAIIHGGECDEIVFADSPPDFMISRLDELAGLIR